MAYVDDNEIIDTLLMKNSTSLAKNVLSLHRSKSKRVRC